MKSWKYIATALLFVLFATPVKADTMKVGVVDFQKALNEVEAGKQAKARLKTEFEGKQKALQTKQDQIKQLLQSLDAQKGALSADAMKQKQAEYQDKVTDLQKTMSQYQQEMAQKEMEVTQGILTQLRQATQKIAAQDGYTFVFEKSQEALLYAPSVTDLTTQVINSANGK